MHERDLVAVHPERFEPDPSADDGVRRIVVCPDCGWWMKSLDMIGDGQPCELEDDEGVCGGVCVEREMRIVPALTFRATRGDA